jgi:hypothetical protein
LFGRIFVSNKNKKTNIMTPTQVKSVIDNEGQTSLVFNNLETGERMSIDTVFSVNLNQDITIKVNTTRMCTLSGWFNISPKQIKEQLELQFNGNSVVLLFS